MVENGLKRGGALKGALSFDTDSVSGRLGKALKLGGADKYRTRAGRTGSPKGDCPPRACRLVWRSNFSLSGPGKTT